VGQLVAVTEKPSPLPNVVRFELNRSLTGMGHERFRNADEAAGPRPAAELARRLFATGQVDAVHIYSNIVTVDLATGGSPAGLSDVVRNLYRYWQPGMAPPSFEDLAPAEEPAADAGAAAPGGDAGGDAALAAAAKRVPMHLLERSRAARDRWKAKQA
jgi:Scaffold protein Nfu/NifU N terminal